MTLALLAAAFGREIGAATALVYTRLVVTAVIADRMHLRRLIPLVLPALGALFVALIPAQRNP
jgi:hypothetical protein